MRKRTISIIYFILLIAWMTAVFLLSNQDADSSTKTSNIIVLRIADFFRCN